MAQKRQLQIKGCLGSITVSSPFGSGAYFSFFTFMQQKIFDLKSKALAAAAAASSLADLESARVKYAGRKSELTALLRSLKDMEEKERFEAGKVANEARAEIEAAFARKEEELRNLQLGAAAKNLDVTLPAKKIKRGHLHPLTLIQEEIEDIFGAMGFAVADGPDIETEWHNFDALNIPKDHPARDKWDTFWIKSENPNFRAEKKRERILLRTHTSPVQVRYMQTHKPPLRIIAPGKCFRNEATDATHEHTFYQFEALMVDKEINVGNFKHVAQEFFSRFFGQDVTVRLRPSFFPFTEPSFEFDISCTVCGGRGCASCKHTGWLEVGGAGMVNQEVFVAAGYRRGQWQGFAWGFGLERLLMMRSRIPDIRLFHSGDLRFTEQF